MKSWKNLALLTLSSALIVGSFLVSDAAIKRTNQAQILKNGVNTCIARVTQTFTALMIRDTASSFLTPDFMAMSSECLTEAKNILNNNLASVQKDIHLLLNKLTSDVIWFQDKVVSLNEMASQDQINLTGESNIVQKYESLNEQASELTNLIGQEADQLIQKRKIAVALGALGGMLLLSFAFVILRNRNKEIALLASYNSQALSIINEVKEGSHDAQVKTDRLLENLFLSLNMPDCLALNQMNLRIETSPKSNAKVASEKLVVAPIIEKMQPQANLSEILSKELVQTSTLRTLNVHQEIHANISVNYNNEDFSQYMRTLFTYIENKTSTHGIDNISVIAKPLGSIAYVKVSLEDFLFTSNELEYFSTGVCSGNDIDMNLHLLQEIAKEIGLTITLKNLIGNQTKSSQGQIELTMTRTQESDRSPVLKKLIKGSKKEILESMRNS